MYIVTYLFRTAQHAIQLHFNDLDSAVKAMGTGEGEVKDAYGCVADVNSADVVCVYVTDLEHELEAQEKIEMMKAKAMIRAQNKAKSDPGLLIMNNLRKQ